MEAFRLYAAEIGQKRMLEVSVAAVPHIPAHRWIWGSVRGWSWSGASNG
jgi:hypothetical protein